MKNSCEKAKLSEYLMVAPFALLFFTFTILPVGLSILLSFTNFDMLQMPKFVGLSNYISLFLEDDVFLIAVKNTLIFAFLTGPVSYFACLFFAWMINDLGPKLRSILTLVFYGPTLAGNLFIMWKLIFSGDRYGMLNGFLVDIGILNDPVKWLTDPRSTLTIIIIVQLWMSLGVGFLSFIAGLQGIDNQLYEAGAIDGIKNRFQELVYITLPSMGPMLLFGAIMQISASFGVGGISRILAGFPSTDYAAHTIILHIQDYALFRFEMGYASAVATILFLTMLITNKVIRKVLSRFS